MFTLGPRLHQQHGKFSQLTSSPNTNIIRPMSHEVPRHHLASRKLSAVIHYQVKLVELSIERGQF